MKINKTNMNKGFTLIEILVATFIFMIIMLAAIGALVSVSNSAKKAKALRAAMDNVNYAMDNISRSLRLGSNFYCGKTTLPVIGNITQDCSSIGDESIAFMPVYHSQSDASFELNNLTHEILKCENKTPSCTSLTAPEVEITELMFYVNGSYFPSPSIPSDDIQPSVFVRIKGKVTVSGEITEFSLQNYVSQRNLE